MRDPARILCSSSSVPLLEDGQSYSMLIDRSQSMGGLVVGVLRQLGPCDVLAVSFAADAGVLEEIGLRCRRLRLIVHDTAPRRRRKSWARIEAACDEVHLALVHAKVVVAEGGGRGVVISGSGNLTRNQGAEWLDIVCDPLYAGQARAALESKLGAPWQSG